MRAEGSTLAGLIALLRYVAQLLQEAGAPGLPIEVPFAGRWSAAFGTFCANVAGRLIDRDPALARRSASTGAPMRSLTIFAHR
jgi:hypothetical protein